MTPAARSDPGDAPGAADGAGGQLHREDDEAEQAIIASRLELPTMPWILPSVKSTSRDQYSSFGSFGPGAVVDPERQHRVADDQRDDSSNRIDRPRMIRSARPSATMSSSQREGDGEAEAGVVVTHCAVTPRADAPG